MSLPQRAHRRFRPWYLLDALAFLLGAVSHPTVRPGAILGDGPGSPDPVALVTAVAAGLLGVVVVRFTLGNAWGYAVEYVDAGGSWTDGPLWAPAAAGTVAGVASYAATTNLGAAVWTGFWTFAFAAGAAAVAVSFAAGYRDAAE
ncbi:hypothetical protein [Halobellus ruber]|uniref:Uncharacterized protein n=1 Tax=Halobellus ruber TaxID=2761102 RepID=A0A7J9SGF3_9EURY|nr:hypothetical protein [Halobellus ruber]MBB6645209.1 hypothetical protein [Halobellus ruber]